MEAQALAGAVMSIVTEPTAATRTVADSVALGWEVGWALAVPLALVAAVGVGDAALGVGDAALGAGDAALGVVDGVRLSAALSEGLAA